MEIRNNDNFRILDLQTQLEAEGCKLSYPRQLPMNTEDLLLKCAIALEALGSNPPLSWYRNPII